MALNRKSLEPEDQRGESAKVVTESKRKMRSLYERENGARCL